jgi:3-oxoacyl-[acyl-carrier-protein] synthase III
MLGQNEVAPTEASPILSLLGPLPTALDILGFGVVLPDKRRALEEVRAEERERIDTQLAMLSPAFRERLLANLGLFELADFGSQLSSDAGRSAAALALSRAALDPVEVGLVLDYSTFAADCPSIWSLAHDVQGHLGANTALALGVRGSGCAGLHAALLVAAAMLAANPTLGPALLVAADRAPDAGRSCLPISFMADAATALVVARASAGARPLARIRSVAVQQVGHFSRVLVAEGNPPRMRVDAATFERKVLPLHFVMLHRVLSRALADANLQRSDLSGIVYPNTTALDRQGIARGFGFEEKQLLGAGPAHLGHAFANDMLINASAGFDASNTRSPQRTAWLAAGSGFSWGAAIVETGFDYASG